MSCNKNCELYWQNINREENPEELNKILKNREIESIKEEEFYMKENEEYELTEIEYVYKFVKMIKYELNLLYKFPQKYKYGDKYKLVIRDMYTLKDDAPIDKVLKYFQHAIDIQYSDREYVIII